METEKHVFSVTVENNSGVLSRVSGLFSRRGFNIDSLSVGETENPKVSRMTISARGGADEMEQIQKQLEKLDEVVSVEALDPALTVAREYLLIKFSCDLENRSRVLDLTNIFRANVVDVSETSLIAELTGTPDKIGAFIKLAVPLGMREIVRTGMTAMQRGPGKKRAAKKAK